MNFLGLVYFSILSCLFFSTTDCSDTRQLQQSECGLTGSAELCPGIGPDTTQEECLTAGCCWSAQPNEQQQQCFRRKGGRTIENEDNFEEQVSSGENPPLYEISLRGEFYSYDREEFSPACTQEMGATMEAKAQNMIGPVNARIGVDFCLDKSTEDIMVISTASSISIMPDGLEGVAANSFILTVGGNQTLGNVDDCAIQISSFLEDFMNWGVPILPPADGCPLAVFYNSYFENIGNSWVCLGGLQIDGVPRHIEDKQSYLSENSLGYELSLSGEFVTYNDIPLDPQCTGDYSSQFLQTTLQMIGQVNALIGQQLCTDSPGMQLSTATASLSSNDNVGYTRSTFVASLDSEMAFDWVYDCADDIMIYLSEFGNWGTPIIDQIPGCPIIIFSGPGFQEEDQAWVCR